MPTKLKDFNKNLAVLRNSKYDNSPLNFIDVIDD